MARKIRIGSDGTIIQEDLSVPQNGQMSAPAGTSADGFNVMRRSRYSDIPVTLSPATEQHTGRRRSRGTNDQNVTMEDLWENQILVAIAHYLGSILGSFALLSLVQNIVVLPTIQWVAYLIDGDWWSEALVTLTPMVTFAVAGIMAIRFYWKFPHADDEPTPTRLYWGAFKSTTFGALIGLAACVLIYVAIPLLGVLAAIALGWLLFLA